MKPMKIVVDSLISKLYESEILELDPNMEIIVLNPEDHTNPAWEDVPEVDALFLSYQFLFAVRDHKHLFEPMLEVAKKANSSKADIREWMILFCKQS